MARSASTTRRRPSVPPSSSSPAPSRRLRSSPSASSSLSSSGVHVPPPFPTTTPPLEEVPAPFYAPVSSLSSRTFSFPYTSLESKVLKVLSRSGKSRRYSSLRWSLLLLLSLLCSNLLFSPTPSNKSTSLSLLLLFSLKYLYAYLEDVIALLHGTARRRLQPSTLRQTNRYPQLPRRRQHKYAMLGPTQWMRWQCYQDAVLHFFLEAVRCKYRDLREEYVERDKTFDLSSHSPPSSSSSSPSSSSSSPPSAPFWFDFLADTGDSFNGSYAVAQLLASPLSFPSSVLPSPLPSPSLLLHGGDISYPWPQMHEMWNRFVLPMTYAATGVERERRKARRDGGGKDDDDDDDDDKKCDKKLFIVAGNHEWNDGLVTFHDLFLEKLHRIGCWDLPQRSSYFALKLPASWWVFGIDMIDAGGLPDVDPGQYEYFADVYATKVDKDKDSIIIVTHMPDYFWNSCLGYSRGRRLASLRASFGKNFAVMLSGDMHFYRRFEPPDGEAKFPQLLIVGGGGGFNHSTNNPKGNDVVLNHPFCYEEQTTTTTTTMPQPPPPPPLPFVSAKSYPTPESCEALFCRRIFRKFHAGLAKMHGFQYALILAGVLPRDLRTDDIGLGTLVGKNVGRAARCENFFPLLGFVIMTIIHVIYCLSNYSGNTIFKIKAVALALFHSVLHFLTCLLLCSLNEVALLYVLHFGNRWGSTLVEELNEELKSEELRHLVFSHAVLLGWMFFAGGLVGHLVTSCYFYVTHRHFGFHWNEAFVAIADEDRKSFIRCRIGPGGELDIYAIGIETVPKAWRENVGEGAVGPIIEKEEKSGGRAKAGVPHLIEKVSVPGLRERVEIEAANARMKKGGKKGEGKVKEAEEEGAGKARRRRSTSKGR